MRRATAVTLQRSFYAVGLALGVVAILYFARVWLVPLALAVLLAFVLNPVVGWLERRQLPRGPAVALASAVALALIVAVGYLVTLQLTNLAEQLQENGAAYRQNVSTKLAPLIEMLESAQQLENIGKKGLPPHDGAAPAQRPPTPVVVESQGMAALSWLPSVVWPVVDIGGRGLLVVILAIFVLARRESLRDRVLAVLGARNVVGATRAMNDTAHRVSHYLFLQLCTNTGLGTVITIGLYCIGVPYALLCGMLAAALRFIPYIGVWVAAALAFAVGVMFFPGWTPALLVLALFVVAEAVTGNAIEPLLFGHGTGVSPLPLLVAAVFWAWMWGPAGLLLSTPLTVCLVVLGRHVPALRFIDVLLGTRAALDDRTRCYQRLLAGDLEEAAAILQCLQGKQPLDAICDEVVLPALSRARVQRDDDALTADEERSVLRATRIMLHTALTPEPAEATAPPTPAFRVLGCPARGAADALALHLLDLLLRQVGGELHIVSVRRLSEEMQRQASDGQPAVICIGTLPPDGTVQLAHATRHARRATPSPKIIVGLWGQAADAGKADERLRAAGAAAIAATLREAVDQVLAACGKTRPVPVEQPATPVPAAASA